MDKVVEYISKGLTWWRTYPVSTWADLYTSKVGIQSCFIVMDNI